MNWENNKIFIEIANNYYCFDLNPLKLQEIKEIREDIKELARSRKILIEVAATPYFFNKRELWKK